MAKNVFVLGAGFSLSAGIPLLRDFGQTMWELSERRSYQNRPLTADQSSIFRRAAEIRETLDDYHGRAQFDDRNIEDILSILLFDTLGGSSEKAKTFDDFVRAIAETVEITCSVKHPGIPARGNFEANKEGPEEYRTFWRALFEWVKQGHEMPVIVTFNYDLVLERSFLQTVINTYYDGYKSRLPKDAISFQFGFEHVRDRSLQISYVSYGHGEKNGTIAKEVAFPVGQDLLGIELYKLHGSVNFPKDGAIADDSKFNVAQSLPEPFLLPPIFSKVSSGLGSQMWAKARDHLRFARNIIFVGYSLPRTDIYMQYFLKSALGPNRHLNRISVFDPLLFSPGSESTDMRARFAGCFSSQVQRRLDFEPLHSNGSSGGNGSGTMRHFVNVLEKSPQQILFF